MSNVDFFHTRHCSNCGDIEHGKPAQGGVVYTVRCGIHRHKTAVCPLPLSGKATAHQIVCVPVPTATATASKKRRCVVLRPETTAAVCVDSMIHVWYFIPCRSQYPKHASKQSEQAKKAKQARGMQARKANEQAIVHRLTYRYLPS